jgi:adenylate cyclase
MPDEEITRKLAAIFYADVAGYSRLTEDDELGTHRKVMAALDLSASTITESNGTVLRYAGDAILAEFSSVTRAIEVAVEIQTMLIAQNLDLDDDKKVQIRIGINLGEVMTDRGEIYGSGVNLAARLESIAQPSGICISGALYDQVKGKTNIAFEDGGLRELKNIAQPTHVYHWYEQVSKIPGDSNTPETLADNDKPSIAVLPFDNMSGDPEQEYFSDGISEDIITDLSKVSSIFIVARNSSFTYKGRAVKIQEVCADLGVRYVVEGSVRKSGNRVRITAQLIDGSSGGHIWADRYDGTLEDIFELQDQVTGQIVEALKVKLLPEEKKAIRQSPTANIEAYDLYLKGRQHFHYNTRENFVTAEQYFNRAIESDKTYARAYCGLADCGSYLNTEHAAGHEVLVAALAAANKAIEISPGLGEAHASLGFVLSATGNYSGATREFRAAVQLDPGLYAARYYWGRTCIAQGKREQGIEHLEAAWKLSPKDPQTPGLLAQFYRDLGRQSDLEHAAQQAVKLGLQKLETEPENWRACGSVAFGYLNLGEVSNACKYMERSLESNRDDMILNYNAGCLYNVIGNTEKAIKHLQISLQHGVGTQLKDWIEHDNDLDSIRDHPKFLEMMKS